jgi:hypothetical protein
MVKDAGPEAGIPTEAAWPYLVKGGKRGVGGRLEAGFGGKWLCSIIRIYRLLYKVSKNR